MIHPKVTVIIPTFNRWPYVCEAIDSVINQTYKNTECFIVDDFSTDFTYENIINKTILNNQKYEKLSLEQYIEGNSYLNTNNFMLSRKNMLQYGMFNVRLTNREGC